MSTKSASFRIFVFFTIMNVGTYFIHSIWSLNPLFKHSRNQTRPIVSRKAPKAYSWVLVNNHRDASIIRFLRGTWTKSILIIWSNAYYNMVHNANIVFKQTLQQQFPMAGHTWCSREAEERLGNRNPYNSMQPQEKLLQWWKNLLPEGNSKACWEKLIFVWLDDISSDSMKCDRILWNSISISKIFRIWLNLIRGL